MKLRVLSTEFFVRDLHTRIPFRYGIATLTKAPHLFVRTAVEIDRRMVQGLAADNLPPKWFTKNPASSFRADLEELLEVIRTAAAHAERMEAAESVFEFWQALSAAQKATATERGWPPLLAGFGVSLVERAVMDAFCHAMGRTFAETVRENAFGVRLEAIYPELKSSVPADWLPAAPLQKIIARHTVGLTDPLTAADLPDTERVDDGLPQTLDDCIRAQGLTHFKIKLCGEIDRDRDRLHALAGLLAREAPGCRFTLDGNENYRAVEPFRELWEQFLADPTIRDLLRGLIFVEQPLHRDVALMLETTSALLAWPERPPLVIDESEGEVGTLALALAGGYAGTSHKNCKGIIKGIANACLIAHRRALDPAAALHLSGEDLTNVGPVALLQDLAVVATLGITHAERNGHHYFAGLSEFPASVQRAVLAAHGDLYREHRGYPAVRVERGKMSTHSAITAPFGYGIELATAEFTPLAEWSAEGF